MEMKVFYKDKLPYTRIKLSRAENEIIKKDVNLLFKVLKALNGRFDGENSRYAYYVFEGDLINIRRKNN